MGAEESVINYFSYVKNVLGVKTLQSARLSQKVSEKSEVQTYDLVFVHVKSNKEPSVFAADSKELLDKMIQAMRLGSRTYTLLEKDSDGAEVSAAQLVKSSLQNIQTAFVVIFSSKPVLSGKIQNLGATNYLETFSPQYLLQNAASKKVVWADLQKVMKELGVL